MLSREEFKGWILFMIPFYFGYMAGKSDSLLNMILLIVIGMLIVFKINGSEGE